MWLINKNEPVVNRKKCYETIGEYLLLKCEKKGFYCNYISATRVASSCISFVVFAVAQTVHAIA